MGYRIPENFGLVQVNVRTVAGHNCVNSFGVELSATPTQSQVDDLSQKMANAYKLVLNSGSVYEGLKVYIGQPDPFPLNLLESTVGTIGGTRGVALASPQTQVLAKKRTLSVGKQYRGRTYFMDVSEGGVGDTGALSAGEITLYQTLASTIQNLMATTGTTFPGLGHRLLHGEDTTTAPSAIVSFSVEPICATQRRRLER